MYQGLACAWAYKELKLLLLTPGRKASLLACVSDTVGLWHDVLNFSAMLPESDQLEFQNLVPGQRKDKKNHMQLTLFSDDVTPNAAAWCSAQSNRFCQTGPSELTEEPIFSAPLSLQGAWLSNPALPSNLEE